MLASSLFDGMDGIEYYRIDSNEIGGSMELDSNNDSTSALGIAFSPWKMRSGKVVRYRNKE